MSSLAGHLKLHARFYVPAALGVGVWLAMTGQGQALRLLVAGDTFFAAHIVAMGLLALPSRHETFRQRAGQGDEGLLVITLITLAALTLSLGSIFTLLNHQVAPTPFTFTLAIASLPLGWCMLHTVSAFHYAHAYYGQAGAKGQPRGGIAFPGKGDPQAWDFLYYAFVVGMTAQVSDVSVLTTRMRKLTLGHSVVSFFFNTVILALAVNVSVMLAS